MGPEQSDQRLVASVRNVVRMKRWNVQICRRRTRYGIFVNFTGSEAPQPDGGFPLQNQKTFSFVQMKVIASGDSGLGPRYESLAPAAPFGCFKQSATLIRMHRYFDYASSIGNVGSIGIKEFKRQAVGQVG